MKSHFYKVQRTKEGWAPKFQTKNYKYIRMLKSPVFSTVEESEAYIREKFIPQYKGDRPWIDHKLGKYSSGYLMTLENMKRMEGCK